MFKDIDLFPSKPDCSLSAYIHEDNEVRPCVIVCPGGSYRYHAAREAEPIAMFYYNEGFNTFILRYSVAKEAANYAPLIEAAMTIKHIRENAVQYCVDPEKIVICGFSAGGHLAGSAGILWNIPEVRDAIGVTDGKAPEGINRPNGIILCYAVITAGEYTHRGSIQNITGREDYDEKDVERFSLELHVNESTPPMFIWHTLGDRGVHIKNALQLMNAYSEQGISYEAHIYPNGPHGMSLCNKTTWEGKHDLYSDHNGTWKDLSVMWMHECI